jgi:hypothetical protein
VRAITGFITIDAKSYASQIQETVTFLSTVRDAVKAAGYDVAGIRNLHATVPRIHSWAQPAQTRWRCCAPSTTSRHSCDSLPTSDRDGERHTDDPAPADLAVDILSQTGNRLNANIIVRERRWHSLERG